MTVFRPLRFCFGLIVLLFLGISQQIRADALDTWFIRSSGVTNALKAAAYGNSKFVIVGERGLLLNSTNGTNWESRVYPANYPNPPDFNCVSYGTGMFVAGMGLFANLSNIVVSTDATNWKGFYSCGPPFFYGNLLGATFGDGNSLLVGGGMGGGLTILAATNIDLSHATNCNWILWTAGGNTPLTGVAYGNGVYVAVGYDCSFTSTNLTNWTSNHVNGFGGFYVDVVFGNGIFVAVSDFFGSISTSANGSIWSPPKFQNQDLYRIAFGNGVFVAVGRNGTILTSHDGISWKKRASPVSALLLGVSYGNGTFVIAGEGGTILQSDVMPPSLAVEARPDRSAIMLTLTGQVGHTYRIQVASNLRDTTWTDLVTFTNDAGTTQFLDTDTPKFLQRFYRAVSP